MIAMAPYARPDAPIDVGQLFDRFLRRHELEKQDVAYQVGQRPEAISRAIQGTGPLDLWALSRLPTELLVAFFKSVVRARIEAELENIAARPKVPAKAALPDTTELKRRA